MNRSLPAATDADTFDRSCAHWSADGREGMDNFYTYATVDYRHLAGLIDWSALLASLSEQTGGLQLADLACGSGKFPTALLEHTTLPELMSAEGRSTQVLYDLLDPSTFAIEEAAAVLKSPFLERDRYCCRLQDWQPKPSTYDLCWATHALYCVPAAEMGECMAILKGAMKPGGIGVVAQSNRSGHYIRFYEHFLESIHGGNGTRFSAAEDVAEAAENSRFERQIRTLNYETAIDENDHQALESYLQRCAFDDSISLHEMMNSGSLGQYLKNAKSRGAYRFQQSVDVVVFGNDLSSFNFWMQE
ncbi:MAG: class I SAM-dependent methyltransferase [Candidatus Binatia bacterium]|nr:class I SAM-dependent methyltransferase [Candidatus Binatia bacterium]